MDTTLTNAAIFIILILLTIYSSMNIRLMRKPLTLIIIGIIVCVLSALMQFIFDSMTKHFKTEIDKSTLDITKNIFMMSIASLGGGLISAGITNKATVEHNKQVLLYKEMLESLEDELSELYISRDKVDQSEEQKEFYNRMIAKKEFRRNEILSKMRNVETL
ncbi:hypothetical protein [Aeromonas hydrophila]|uniref:hypothetical protein n=1 Tax=Aeromonas hydrophila TaxID=644 RepID=UPI002B46179A|nr:hypothetical protein [Aeromonas hydrophila]